MAGLVEAIQARRQPAEILGGLVAQSGSESHPYPRQHLLDSTQADARNLADAIHMLGMLHVQRPGIFDLTLERLQPGEARDWISRAIDTFAAERAYVTRLVVAAGPIPGTPGHAGAEAAVVSQRNAIEMLARSERQGCPLGASIGLLLDWPFIREVLDSAALKFGVARPAADLPSEGEMLALVDSLARDTRTDRAICFGVEQLLLQHRALWDLLEARCLARR